MSLLSTVSGGGGTTSPLTTKGDVYVFGSEDERLPVGANNTLLTPDSGEALGVKWAWLVLDEDNMTSDSDTSLVTQQSVKAYIDTADALKLNLDTSNDPLTGNLEVSKADPEIRLTDPGNSNYTRITLSDISSLAQRLNLVSVPSADAFAIIYDGSNDFMNCGNDASLNNISIKTIIVTFKITAGETGNPRIMAKSDVNTEGFNVQWNGSSDLLIFRQGFSGTDGRWDSDASTIEDNTWYQLVIVYDSSSVTNDPIFYLNGSLINVNEIDTPVGTVESDAAHDLLLAARNNGGSENNFLAGTIDMTAIYSAALSANDVSDLWNNGDYLIIDPAERFPTDNDLMGDDLEAVWYMDEGQMNVAPGGADIEDSSSNTNHGTAQASMGDEDFVIGVVPSAPPTQEEALIWKSEDGIIGGEKGQLTIGDSSGETTLTGESVLIEIGTDVGDDCIIGNNNALLIEGDTDRVGIQTPEPSAPLDLSGANENNPFGSINPLVIFNATQSLVEGGRTFISGIDSISSASPDRHAITCNLIGDITNREVINVGVDSENVRRFRMTAVGNHEWGSGSSALDTFVERNSGGGLLITNTTVGIDLLTIKGAASQSGSLLKLTDSSDNIFFNSGKGLTNSEVVWNEQGVDIDHRMESVNEDKLFLLDAGNDSLRFGDGDTNYTNFAVDGLMTMAGTARVKKHLVLEVSNAIRGAGAAAPTQVIIGNYAVLQFSNVVKQNAYIIFHTPDDWAVGTDMKIHAHWAPVDGNAGDVVWDIDYSAIASDSNELISGGGTNITVTDSTQGLQDELLLTTDITIVAANLAVNDAIGICVSRDTTDGADTYGAVASLVYLEIKYITDKLGEAT